MLDTLGHYLSVLDVMKQRPRIRAGIQGCMLQDSLVRLHDEVSWRFASDCCATLTASQPVVACGRLWAGHRRVTGEHGTPPQQEDETWNIYRAGGWTE